MCPSIILDQNDDVLLLIGGAGGSKITTATAYVSHANKQIHILYLIINKSNCPFTEHYSSFVPE